MKKCLIPKSNPCTHDGKSATAAARPSLHLMRVRNIISKTDAKPKICSNIEYYILRLHYSSLTKQTSGKCFYVTEIEGETSIMNVTSTHQ